MEIRQFLDHVERAKILAPSEPEPDLDHLIDSEEEEPWLENPVVGAQELLRFFRVRELLRQ